MNLTQQYYAALNKVAKWHAVFAGWQLGTRPKGDPECDAVRDHREVTILLRAEVTALTQLLMESGVFSVEDLHHAIIKECALLEQDYERRFPGVKATDIGMQFDARAGETMRGWKP